MADNIVWDDEASGIKWDDAPAPKSRTLLQTLNPLNNPLVAGAYGIAEAGTNLLTGTGAAAVGGLRGLNALAAGEGMDEATRRIQETTNDYTYEPRTQQGRTLVKAAAAPVEAAGAAGGYAGKVLGQSLSGAAPTSEKAQAWGDVGELIGKVGTEGGLTVLGGKQALRAAPPMPTYGVPKQPTGAQVLSSRKNAAKLEALQTAETQGFTIPAMATRDKATMRETLAGPKNLAIDVARRNQDVANQGMIRNVLRDPDAVELNAETFARAEERATQPYREIEQLPSIPLDETFRTQVRNLDEMAGVSPEVRGMIEQAPEAHARMQRLSQIAQNMDQISGADAVRAMSDLRRQSSDVLFGGGQVSQADRAVARAQRRLSDALEQNVERSLGDSDLAARFRDGRTWYAQIQELKGATNRATNNVDPTILGRAASEGDLLTGYLGDTANVAAHFPDYMKSVDQLSGIPHSSQHSSGGYAARSIAGHVAGPAGYAATTVLSSMSPKWVRDWALTPEYIRKKRMQDYRPLRERMGVAENVNPPPLELAPQGPLPPSPMGGTVVGTGPVEPTGTLGLAPQLDAGTMLEGSPVSRALRSGARDTTPQSPQMPAVEMPLKPEMSKQYLSEIMDALNRGDMETATRLEREYAAAQEALQSQSPNPVHDLLYEPFRRRSPMPPPQSGASAFAEALRNFKGAE